MKKRQQKGVTLIEVLITILILAGGMLGMAALQSRSLMFNNIAYLNTLSNMMAFDMLDRIRANSVYAIDGPGYSVSVGNTPADYNNDCETGNCTPVELAQYDIDQWKYLLDQHLPDGDGTIVKTDSPEGRNYTITVFFDDSKGQDSPRQIILRSTL